MMDENEKEERNSSEKYICIHMEKQQDRQHRKTKC